jgi:ribosomal-protein-alanine N-acetyltransferase
MTQLSDDTAAEAFGTAAEAFGTAAEALGAAGAVRIVPMRRRHLRGVMAIEQVTNHKPWSLGLFMGELRMPTSRHYVVALDGHEVVGFCGLMVTADEGHITNIAVHPDRRRESVAARLMLVTMRRAAAEDLAGVTLEVRTSNVAAQELYRRFGFAPGGIRRNYYADVGEDGLIMWAHDIDTDEYRQRLAGIETALPTPLLAEGTT